MVVFLMRTGSVSSITSPGYDAEDFVSKYVFHIDFVTWQDIYCGIKTFPNDADKITVWAALCLRTDGIVVVRGARTSKTSQMLGRSVAPSSKVESPSSECI